MADPAAVIPQFPAILDLAGTAVFALSGALLAARLKQTFVTMGFFALITGVGGGSVRDLLIGAPVFWVRDPWVAAVCLGVALIAWFTPRRWWEGQLLEYADAAGLAAYAMLGTAKALAYAVAPVPAVVMGIVTGCVGGIMRDVLAGRPSILMRPELYVTAAALSAAICAAGAMLTAPRELVWTLAVVAGFALRASAIRFGIHLPSYKRADV
ncbi:MAG: TRIC cation channel family protein [Sphingomonadales bacterium]|nr:TRIC cation channel family protein [Sphingomonadales bacterium]